MVVILLLTPCNHSRSSNISLSNASEHIDQSSVYYVPAICKEFSTAGAAPSTFKSHSLPSLISCNGSADISPARGLCGHADTSASYNCSKFHNLLPKIEESLQLPLSSPSTPSPPPPSLPSQLPSTPSPPHPLPLPPLRFSNNQQKHKFHNEHKPNQGTSHIYSYVATKPNWSVLYNEDGTHRRSSLLAPKRPNQRSRSGSPSLPPECKPQYKPQLSASSYRFGDNRPDPQTANCALRYKNKNKTKAKAHAQPQPNSAGGQEQFISIRLHTYTASTSPRTALAKHVADGTVVPIDATISAAKTAPGRNGNFTNITDFVHHVTRVNFYDIDTSQVESDPKDNADEDDNASFCDTEVFTSIHLLS